MAKAKKTTSKTAAENRCTLQELTKIADKSTVDCLRDSLKQVMGQMTHDITERPQDCELKPLTESIMEVVPLSESTKNLLRIHDGIVAFHQSVADEAPPYLQITLIQELIKHLVHRTTLLQGRDK